METSIAPTVPSSRAGGSARSVTAEVEDGADRPRLEGRQQQLLQKAGYNSTFPLPAVPLAPDSLRFTLP